MSAGTTRRTAGAVFTSAAIALVCALPAAAGAAHPVPTHGPDSAVGLGEQATATGPGFRVGGMERPAICTSGHHVRLFYAYPAGGPNNLAANAATIRSLFAQANHTLNAEGVASGPVETDYRARCIGGTPTVEAFPVADGPGDAFTDVLDGLRAAGLEFEDTKHMMFMDGTGPCGQGSYVNDNRLESFNGSNAKGWAVVWNGPSNCWSEGGVIHELGHTMGAVVSNPPPDGPPNGNQEGHCTDEHDIMCQAVAGFPVTVVCDDGKAYFDCNYDDYFDTAPEAGEWLESHWNLGNPLNRYLHFGGGLPPDYDPGTAPPADPPGGGTPVPASKKKCKAGKKKGRAGTAKRRAAKCKRKKRKKK